MDNLLLDNQVIILASDIEFDDLKKKIVRMHIIISKFINALEMVYTDYAQMLQESRQMLSSWKNTMQKADAPKSLLMTKLVQFINHVTNEINSVGIDFDQRDDKKYINTLFAIDTNQEYEPVYLLRPIAIDFVSLWANPATTMKRKKQILDYLYLISKFGKSVMNTFVIMDKDEFQEKFGLDLANFDIDNMSFNVKSISDSFAKMLNDDDETVDTTPLTETVNTVLTEFLGVTDPTQDINLQTLTSLHSQSTGLTDRLDRISNILDTKGINDQDLKNSVTNLSKIFAKKSGIKDTATKELFEKLANGENLDDPSTFEECQKLMSNNPLFKQFGLNFRQ